MAIELFEVDERDSLVRRILQMHGEINLSEFELPSYQINPGYTVKEINLSSERNQYAREIRSALEPISQEAENSGYSPMLFTALYEAVLNAHQHGNKFNQDKKVKVAYKFDAETAEVAIIDEGGILHPDFISFVLRHREGKHFDQFLDWYSFTGQDKPESNNGTGTSFIHTYAHNVQYFKSDEGGLVVHLTRHKSKEEPLEDLVN